MTSRRLRRDGKLRIVLLALAAASGSLAPCERAGADPVFTVDFDVVFSPTSLSVNMAENGRATLNYAFVVKNVTVKKDGQNLGAWEYVDFVHPNRHNFVPIQYKYEWLPYGGQEFIAFYESPEYLHARRVWVTGALADEMDNADGSGKHWENVSAFGGRVDLFAGKDAYDANGNQLQDEGRAKRYYDAYIEHDRNKFRHSSWSDTVFLRITPEVLGVPSTPADYAFAITNVRTSNSLTITAEVIPEPGSASLILLALGLLGAATTVRNGGRRRPNDARNSREDRSAACLSATVPHTGRGSR